MKIDAVIKKECLCIAAGEGIFCLLQLAFCLIFRLFSLPILFSTLLSGFLAVLNFFLMALTVQKAVSYTDAEAQKRLLKLSQSLRLLFLALLLLLFAFLFKLKGEVVALLLPLFSPRITVMIRTLLLKKEDGGK